MVLGIIDIQADVDYILFHRRLRFCFMVGALQLTNLRYPSLMVALGSAKDGGVYTLVHSLLSWGERPPIGDCKIGLINFFLL